MTNPSPPSPQNYTLLTWQERRDLREQYLQAQDGDCFYCKAPLYRRVPKNIRKVKIDRTLFPGDFLKYPVHLQHNHDTNMTEGAVHAHCNAHMWHYEGR